MTSKYARRRDALQTRRDNLARHLGIYVVDLWQAAQFVPGLPDALWATLGHAVLCEHKNGDEPLTTDEAKFHAAYPGPIDICRSDGDVERIAQEHLGVRIT